MEILLVIFGDDGQVELLLIDTELVIAEFNEVVGIEKILFVFELTNGVFANGFQTPLNVIGFDGVFQFDKFGDDVAYFVDH